MLTELIESTDCVFLFRNNIRDHQTQWSVATCYKFVQALKANSSFQCDLSLSTALLAIIGMPDPLHEQLQAWLLVRTWLQLGFGVLDLSSVVTYLALATCRTVGRVALFANAAERCTFVASVRTSAVA